ncbi:MAG: hypothetical protein MZV70_64895 [Desulfobacterales bacterium]|nr:hypothetical protein [Desulfobacterales bacterium]
MQALRPLAISAALDLVLAHPQWKDHIDATQIGGFGASMGGETMLLLGGAGLTTLILRHRVVVETGHPRYIGSRRRSATCRISGSRSCLHSDDDQDGLDGISLPFLGISGTADTTAPIYETKIGMKRLTGTRELVALAGVEHGFDVALDKRHLYVDAYVSRCGGPRKPGDTKSSSRRWRAWRAGGDDSVVILLQRRAIDVTRARRRIEPTWSRLRQEWQHVCRRSI